MATWRLTAPHYMNVKNPDDPDNPVEWIQEETDMASGRRLRKRHKVPMYLDPADPSTIQYYGVNGEILVTLEDGKIKGPRGTLYFSGDPTPDMEPMDEEAEEISAKVAATRQSPMGEGAFPGQGKSYGDRLFEELSSQLSALISNNPIPKAAGPVPTNYVTQEQLAEVMKQMAALTERNKELEAKLGEVEDPVEVPPVASPKAEPVGRRL